MLNADMFINLTNIIYYFEWLDLYMLIIWNSFYSLMFVSSWRCLLFTADTFQVIPILLHSGDTYLKHSALLSNAAIC